MGTIRLWQDATDKHFQSVSAAKAHAGMLKRVNPRREFKVFKVTGPRGGSYYHVCVKET